MVDKKRPKKPTVKSNKELGKKLQESLLDSSKEIEKTSTVLNTQSEKLLESIDKALKSEDNNLLAIINKLTGLNKDAEGYEETLSALTALKEESEAKIKSLQSLERNTSITSELIQKLLEEVIKKDDDQTSDLLAEQLGNLSETAKYLEMLGEKSEFDIDELLEASANVLDKKQLEKIEKRLAALAKLDSFLLNPAKEAGLFSTLTDYIAASALGPLGKPIADLFKLNERVETRAEKLLAKITGLEEKQDEDKKAIDFLTKKIDKSSLSEEDKQLLKRQLENMDEREDDIENDRTQDYRTKQLTLQRELIDKTDTNSFGIAQILGTLTGGRLIKSLAGALTGALTAGTATKLLKGSLFKESLKDTFKTGGKTASMGSSLLKRAGAAGAVYGAWEAGQFVGEKIDDVFGDDLSKGIWWALEEAPDDIKAKYLEAKEYAANTILNNATTSFQEFSNKYGDNFSYLNTLKDFFFGDENEEDVKKKEITSALTKLSNENNNSYVYNNSNSNSREQTITKYPKETVTQQVIIKNENAKQQSQSTNNNVSVGKINNDDIPMYSSNDSLLLLTKGGLK